MTTKKPQEKATPKRKFRIYLRSSRVAIRFPNGPILIIYSLHRWGFRLFGYSPGEGCIVKSLFAFMISDLQQCFDFLYVISLNHYTRLGEEILLGGRSNDH